MNDGKNLPIWMSDFSELVKNDFQLVDKSLFIKAVMNDSALAIVITRPSGFGRTVNLSMLKYFLSNDKQYNNLFEGLVILNDKEFCQKHQNHYPVIYLSFKNVGKESFQSSLNDIQKIVSELYTEHNYLLEDLDEYETKNFMEIVGQTSDKTILRHSLEYLTEYLSNKFGQNPILLIDDYDIPFQEAYLGGYYEEMVSFMRSILGAAIKDNSFLKKAIVIGATRISAKSLDSQLNNIWVETMLSSRYSKYFGFIEDEVRKLIESTGLSINISAIKEWYNGYKIGEDKLYNPYSTLHCLANLGALKSYWLNKKNFNSLQFFFKHTPPYVKRSFVDLLQGNAITLCLEEGFYFPDLPIYGDEFFLFLYYNGYLQVLSSELVDGRNNVSLVIANQEILEIYAEIIRRWFTVIANTASFGALIQSIHNDTTEKFRSIFTTYMSELEKDFVEASNSLEQILSCIILGLAQELQNDYLINLKDEISRSIKMLFMPKDKQSNGIILLFNVVEMPVLLKVKAKEMLNQIKSSDDPLQIKQYFIENDTSSVLIISLTFWERQLEIVSENISFSAKMNG